MDTLLLSMLQGLLSTSEMSESIAGHLHSVSTAACVEGIRLDAAPDDNISVVCRVSRSRDFFLCGLIKLFM